MSDNGLVFKVKKSAGIQLEAMEWYPCILKSITPVVVTWQGVEENKLQWEFELLGEKFTMDMKGESKQFSVRGKTSLFTSPKSKMYTWYTSIIGADLDEGQEINLESIIGTECDVMVEPREYLDPKTKTNKIAHDIKLVRRSKKGATATPKVAPKAVKPSEPKVAPKVVETKSVNPKGVTDPADISFDEQCDADAQTLAPDAIFKGIL